MKTFRELAKEALDRAAGATKGPWEAQLEGDYDRVQTAYITASGIDMDGVTPWEDKDTIGEIPNQVNREFIAHAREDVPALALAVINLSDRVDELESTLKGFLPRCNHCGVFATRGYIHCSGHAMTVCDNDKCMEEDFCDMCGQVWYGDDPRCGGFNEDGGQCTGTSKHPEAHASTVYDLRHAVMVRSLQ